MSLSALPLQLRLLFKFVMRSFRGVTAYSMDVFKLYLGQGDLKDRLRMGMAVVIDCLGGVLDSKCP